MCVCLKCPATIICPKTPFILVSFSSVNTILHADWQGRTVPHQSLKMKRGVRMCFEWRSSEAGEKQQGRERIAPRRYIENDAILVINIRTISPGVCFLHWFAPGPHIYLRQTQPVCLDLPAQLGRSDTRPPWGNPCFRNYQRPRFRLTLGEWLILVE